MIDVPARTRDSVAILGFTEHNYQAPWRDPAWDFFGLNDLHGVLERHWPEIFTSGQVQWFQLHRRDSAGQYPGARDPQHEAWLKAQPFPIWMWDHDPNIPSSVPFPLEEMLTRPMLATGEPLSPEQYWTNSISEMMAFAILRGYRTIGLFGVDMAMDGVHGESEYGHQRPSVEYMIGVARGLGIRVVMPQESEVCKCAYIYGFDNVTHARRKLETRYRGLEQAEAEAIEHYEASKRMLYLTRGAAQLVSGGLSEVVKALMDQLPQAERQSLIEGLTRDEQQWLQENEAAKKQLHEVRGAKNNTEWFVRNYWPGDAAVQDVPRSEKSLVLAAVPPVSGELLPSDGHPRTADMGTNRILALTP